AVRGCEKGSPIETGKGSKGVFLTRNKSVARKGGDCGPNSTRRILPPSLTILGATTAGGEIGHAAQAFPAVAGKAQLHDFRVWNKRSPNSTALGANSSRPESRNVVGFVGGWGHVDHLVHRSDGVAASDGARAAPGAGQDRRGSEAFRRHVTGGHSGASRSGAPGKSPAVVMDSGLPR